MTFVLGNLAFVLCGMAGVLIGGVGAFFWDGGIWVVFPGIIAGGVAGFAAYLVLLAIAVSRGG
ncbi:hypothetical protein [Thalassospira povalilytica]|uniref:hypothetical protein n=1 Tax=Thalassospira povalilytica TaxID=732237 RepID=UPI003AA97077